jgi:hypothetical protein
MVAEISGRRPKMPCIGMLKLACRLVSIGTDMVPLIACFGMVRGMVLRAQIKRLAG